MADAEEGAQSELIKTETPSTRISRKKAIPPSLSVYDVTPFSAPWVDRNWCPCLCDSADQADSIACRERAAGLSLTERVPSALLGDVLLWVGGDSALLPNQQCFSAPGCLLCTRRCNPLASKHWTAFCFCLLAFVLVLFHHLTGTPSSGWVCANDCCTRMCT